MRRRTEGRAKRQRSRQRRLQIPRPAVWSVMVIIRSQCVSRSRRFRFLSIRRSSANRRTVRSIVWIVMTGLMASRCHIRSRWGWSIARRAMRAWRKSMVFMPISPSLRLWRRVPKSRRARLATVRTRLFRFVLRNSRLRRNAKPRPVASVTRQQSYIFPIQRMAKRSPAVRSMRRFACLVTRSRSQVQIPWRRLRLHSNSRRQNFVNPVT